MFQKPEDNNGDGDDDVVEGCEPDAPVYAENDKEVVYKKGVEIQKSPYTKVFE